MAVIDQDSPSKIVADAIELLRTFAREHRAASLKPDNVTRLTRIEHVEKGRSPSREAVLNSDAC